MIYSLILSDYDNMIISRMHNRIFYLSFQAFECLFSHLGWWKCLLFSYKLTGIIWELTYNMMHWIHILRKRKFHEQPKSFRIRFKFTFRNSITPEVQENSQECALIKVVDQIKPLSYFSKSPDLFFLYFTLLAKNCVI